MITARILADSINPIGVRLTSWLLTYPRMIHAEIMTHRVASKNAASSRAIPLAKMLKDVGGNPALPEKWGAEQKGMQSGDELQGWELQNCMDIWSEARETSSSYALQLHKTGLHKSICNRLLEPWMHITVLLTMADHGNWFALRAHPMAEPSFQVLAYRMLHQYIGSTPLPTPWGEWHVPQFESERKYTMYDATIEEKLKVATARCARLSYLTFDGKYSIEEDIALHDRLLASGHMSPFEHCAKAHGPIEALAPDTQLELRSNFDDNSRLFCGWLQYRKMIEGENRNNVDLQAIMGTKPDWISV